MRLQDFGRDETLVEVFDINSNRYGDDLGSIDFAIKNRGNHPVGNIKLFFIYKNVQGEIISYSYGEFEGPILPKLALQFHHVHEVTHWHRYYLGKWGEGTIEVRVLDYEIKRSRSIFTSSIGRGLTESELYDKSLGYYRDGHPEEAIEYFTAFIELYPDSELADNAHFWIGECYRMQKMYDLAVLAYQKVIDKYPEGNKVPVAMLHQGITFEMINDKTTAELVFKKLVKDFPKTKEAEVARKKLTYYR